jgi:hypothetical protein
MPVTLVAGVAVVPVVVVTAAPVPVITPARVPIRAGTLVIIRETRRLCLGDRGHAGSRHVITGIGAAFSWPGTKGIGRSTGHTFTRRYGIVTIIVCPACGYPTVGPDLCFYCRPVEALTGDQTRLNFEPL